MKKLSYIYIIENKLNGKIYIGSTSDLQKRKTRHFKSLSKGDHHSIALQRAYDKYGKEAFTFKSICICSLESQLEVEQQYLNNLTPQYNTSKSTTAPMFGRKHTEESKLKFKKRRTIKGEEHYLYGTSWSKERREKILKSRKDSNYKHSDTTKLKMRETALRLGRRESLDKCRDKIMRKIIDSSGNLFKSITECAKFWSISPATVCDILKGRHSKTRKGISFKYAE